MQKIITINLIILFVMTSLVIRASVTGSFKVNGDAQKFYPVIFTDGAWNDNIPTELHIGRSMIHTDVLWLGSLMSKFTFHTTSGGHLANFINAEIIQANASFIAGWTDITKTNNDRKIIIWLKGGGITYYYNSNYAVNPLVYDGVSNPVTYNEPSVYNTNGTNHTFKLIVEPYVNQDGLSYSSSALFSGIQTNSFAGNVGIGTQDTKGYKLSVNGKIRAQEIKVEASPWPDYVFAKDYSLPSLIETEKHIRENGHLLGIPSAADVKANGVDLGDMNAKLLTKIEELTLYLIQLNKKVNDQNGKLKKQELEIKKLKRTSK